MFDQLSEKLTGSLRKVRGRGRLNENNIRDTLDEVKRALLEADVNFQVAKGFVADVRERVVGQNVIDSVDPGQQFVKCFHDALTDLLGGQATGLPIADKGPLVLMVCGLQGSGKRRPARSSRCIFRRLRRRSRYWLLLTCSVRLLCSSCRD